jgi:Ran GTPase-activating protein (RanGAP) involved in mRNA processing and transport
MRWAAQARLCSYIKYDTENLNEGHSTASFTPRLLKPAELNPKHVAGGTQIMRSCKRVGPGRQPVTSSLSLNKFLSRNTSGAHQNLRILVVPCGSFKNNRLATRTMKAETSEAEEVIGFIRGESELDLSSNGLKLEFVTQIAEELSTNTTLFVLNLRSNNIGDVGAAAIANALGSNKSLTHLWLDDNSIRDVGIEALARALQLNDSLEQLGLGGSNMSTAGLTFLAEALKMNRSLEFLGLDRCSINDEGATILAEAVRCNEKLGHLCLDNNHIGDLGATAIADALNERNTTLTRVDLHDNNSISPAIYTAISDVTSANNLGVRLLVAGKELDRSHLHMDHGAVQQIAKELATNVTLESLVMTDAGIDNDGAMALASALARNNTLTHLDLSANNIDATGATAIANALFENSSLQNLVLFCNQFWDGDMGAMAEMLKANSSLVFLALGDNFLEDEFAVAIADALKTNSTLVELNLGGNEIGGMGATAIFNSLNEHNYTLKWLAVGDDESISPDLQKCIRNAVEFNSWLQRVHEHMGKPLEEPVLPLVVEALQRRGCCGWKLKRAHRSKAIARRCKAAAGIMFFLVKAAATKQAL